MITQKIIARTDSLKLDKIISRYGEDSMRQVVFIIVRPEPDSEELIPITIPEDAVGSFRILKPSGNFVIVPMSKSVLASGETAFDVVLPASANTAKGSGYYDIRIISETDKYYFTAQGDFLIDDNIISDEVLEDVSEVNGLIFPDDFLTVEDHVTYIDDDTISTDSTWSSNKINEEIEAHCRGDVSKTVSGNPVTFTDGASAPLVKCVTQITGSHDLHGYDKPWVGGANKNLFNATVDGYKTENVTGTWSGNVYSLNGITFTLNTDSDGNITSITVNGTNGNSNTRLFCPSTPLPANTTYTLNGVPSGYGGTNLALYLGGASAAIGVNPATQDGSPVTFTTVTAGNVKPAINVNPNITVNNAVCHPQLELGDTATSFEPYSNICPITAYTEGEIEVTDGDGNTTTHTTTYPSAIYRGSEDVVNGEVTSETGVDNGANLTWQVRYTGSVNKTLSTNFTSEYVRTNPGIIAEDMEYIQNVGGASVLSDPDSKTVGIYGYGGAVTTSVIYMVVPISYTPNSNIVYTLATPTTSSVTPTNLPIKSLSGYNHIESSTGDMEVEYITQRFQPLIESIAQL